MTAFQRIATLVVAVSLAACSSATDPKAATFGGEYELDTMNGQPMPATDVDLFGTRVLITQLRVTVTLNDGGPGYYGAFKRDSLVALIPLARSGIDTVTLAGVARVEGSVITLAGFGTLGGVVLNADEFTQVHPRGEMHFRRVR